MLDLGHSRRIDAEFTDTDSHEETHVAGIINYFSTDGDVLARRKNRLHHTVDCAKYPRMVRTIELGNALV